MKHLDQMNEMCARKVRSTYRMWRIIFQRKYRGASARQKVPGGTGIGLYLADRIMKLHKGKILVQADGKKSTFTLSFPWSLAQ